MDGMIRNLWRAFSQSFKADDPRRPPLARITSRWAAERIKIRPGASPEALSAFEAKYQVNLPPAFRAYFKMVDGTGDDVDGDDFRFWPLAEVKPLAEHHGWEPAEAAWADHWFLFADHMINAPDFAIRLSRDPNDNAPIACTYGTELHPVAPSFEEFLAVYLTERLNLIL